MKTVTKNSLDNLSMIMPILSESEQNIMVGGTEYYYFSGSGLDQKIVYSGSVSDGYNDVLFIQNTSAGGGTRNNGYKPSLNESQLVELVQTRVHSGTTINLESFSDPNEAGHYNPKTGTISMSLEKLRSSYVNGGNFSEQLSVLNHELAHKAVRSTIENKFSEIYGARWWEGHPEREEAFHFLSEQIAYSAEASISDFDKISGGEQNFVYGQMHINGYGVGLTAANDTQFAQINGSMLNITEDAENYVKNNRR